MKLKIEISESDIRQAVFALLKTRYPSEVMAYFGMNQIEVQTSYAVNAKWHSPSALRLVIEKEVPLCQG